MIQITSLVEMVAKQQVFQVPIAIELLIIVVGDRKETGLILLPQHGQTVTPEIATGHGHDVSRGVVHHPSYHIAQVRLRICAGVVKLVNGQ